jgi:hypothetical protein
MYCDTGPLHTACSVPHPTCSVSYPQCPVTLSNPCQLWSVRWSLWGLGLELGQGMIGRWTSDGTTSHKLALHGRTSEAEMQQ